MIPLNVGNARRRPTKGKKRFVLLAAFAASTPAVGQGTLADPLPVAPQPIPPAQAAPSRPSPAGQASSERSVFVPTGIERSISWISQLYPNCASIGSTVPRVQRAPDHGELTFKTGDSFSSYAVGSPLQHCNDQKASGLFTEYRSADGFVGEDHAEILYLLPNATALVIRYTIMVR